MKSKLKKYFNKLIIEAIILSVLISLTLSLGISFILTISFFLFKYAGIKIVLISLPIMFLVFSILLYFFKFMPNIKKTAKRVDDVGLKERVITSLEFEDEYLPIVNLQRLDTEEILDNVKVKHMKFVPFKKLLIFFLITLVVSISSMIFVNAKVDVKFNQIYQITFNTQGGSKVDNQEVEGGSLILKPKNPKKEGFDFIYWYETDETKEYDFNTLIFQNKTLYSKWEEKSDEDKIIEKLINNLRQIVDRAKVSETLKSDLHSLIDYLEEDIKRDDKLETKIAKIERTRQEILDRIKEEIESLKIYYIGEALKEYDKTYELGEAILIKKHSLIDTAIDNLVETLLSINDRELQVEALLQTADDIEEALEKSNEENDKLRKTLQDLADYLRYLAKEIIEGDIPKDVLENEFIEEMEDIKEQLKDALDTAEPTPEEELEEEVDEIVDEAIGDLLDEEEKEEEKEEGKENEGNEEGESGLPDINDYTPKVVDGITDYTSWLESLKEEASKKLLDPNLSQEQKDALNKYINNIDKKLEELE